MRVDAAFLARWAGAQALLARQFVRGPGSARHGFFQPRGGRLPVLLFSQVAWDDVWQRPQEMALGLARERDVLFVSPVQTHQVAGPLRGRWQPLRWLQGNRLAVACPLILSGEYRARPIRALNARLAGRFIRPLVPGREFAFLANTPFCWPLIEGLDPRAVFYDLMDDFCAFEWAPPEGRTQETRILARASGVLAGTHALLEQFRPRFPSIRFLASGVDFAKLTRPAPEAPELSGLPRPRLLYVGTLNDRLSGDLVAAAARAFPDSPLVLVGPRRATFRAPRFPANVIELGLRPHDDLPGFYQHCDIGLMPFADNEAARAINPIKTLEYLACGLPVVSTPIPDVRRFYEPPVVVAGPGEWTDAIRRALSSDTPAGRTARVEFARGRSWDAMTRSLEAALGAAEAAPA